MGASSSTEVYQTVPAPQPHEEHKDQPLAVEETKQETINLEAIKSNSEVIIRLLDNSNESDCTNKVVDYILMRKPTTTVAVGA